MEHPALWPEVASQCMFVSQMAFFARISDPALGGTYMTLLKLGFCLYWATWILGQNNLGHKMLIFGGVIRIFWFTFLLFKQRQFWNITEVILLQLPMVHLFISFRIDKKYAWNVRQTPLQNLLKETAVSNEPSRNRGTSPTHRNFGVSKGTSKDVGKTPYTPAN